MTRNELKDLHERLCYGHDAEIIIDEAGNVTVTGFLEN